MTTYLVAAAVAAVAAFGATNDPSIPYWRRWDPVALAGALGSVYLLYALVGALVAVLAEHAGWHLISNSHGGDWVNGLTYGIAAFLILRVDVLSFGLTSVAPAKILVDLFLRRYALRLDTAAETAIERKVGDLLPLQLCRASLRVYRKHMKQTLIDRGVPGAAKEHLEYLLALHEEARAGDTRPDSDWAAQTLVGVEFLRGYVAEPIIRQRDATIDLR